MRPSRLEHIRELLARFDKRRTNLEPILEAICDAYTCLPEDAIHLVAVKLQIPAAEVFVASEKLQEANRKAVPAEA